MVLLPLFLLFLWNITISRYSQINGYQFMVVGSFVVSSVFESFNMLLVENFIYIIQNRHGKNKLIINAVGIKMGFNT
jgi:hypothetical protein